MSTTAPSWGNDIKDAQRWNIANLMNQEALCDVTFLIGPDETRFRANKIFLASVSAVFKAMLYGSMSEGRRNSTVSIPDIDVIGFKGVLDFAYCKNPRITIDNVVSISNVAQKYQIFTLSRVCAKYFRTYINQQSFCALLNDAANLHLTALIGSCRAAIKESLGYYAKEIVDSKSFLKMELPAMKVFLQMDDLHIEEEELWDVVLKWVKHQQGDKSEIEAFTEAFTDDSEPSTKRQKLNDGTPKNTKCKSENIQNIQNSEILKVLSPFMRFGLMDGEYFVQKVQPTKCLSQKEMLEISNYIICKDVKCGSFSVKKREFTDILRIDRGDIKWNPSYRKCYNNHRQAISIQTSRCAKLIGIGVFNAVGKMSVSVKIYKRSNMPTYDAGSRMNVQPVVLFALDKRSFETFKPSSAPIRLDFKPHITLQPNERYTIEILKKHQDEIGYYTVQNGKTVKKPDLSHLTVTFSNAASSNATNPSYGAIPTLYFMRR